MFLSLKIALSSLAAHKLRAILAMLGVFLGALALTGVQHVSLGLVRQAEIEIEKLGPNLFIAMSGQVHMRPSGSASASRAAATFTRADARALIQSLPSAEDGAPYVTKQLAVRYQAIKVPSVVVGTTPNYEKVRSLRLAYGRFFTQHDVDDREMVCVIGNTIATKLFGSPTTALGRLVYYAQAPMRIIGVLEPMGADIVGTDQDEQVFVPITTFMRRMSNQDYINGVYINLRRSEDAERAKEAASAILRRRHTLTSSEKDDFSVLTAKDTVQLQQQALDLVQTLGVISSSISFAVGGLGILSIMILLVRSRRLEIGVRRAVGATRLDIVRQFLLESGMMATVGGGLGVGLALGVLAIVSVATGFPFVLEPVFTVLAIGGSAILGLAAGAYPAWQASQLEILDVLR
ncbi:ABC transporter permease [Oceanidesulfovibrio marinus]|uniref:ABC transporter permease n=1 Tax=Oceanidesulfovibrio marinus TaxID=370038 RepID=A0A6P1ZM97_9BACT|nr:ABC transporter permease [Oceanidesulfovibrio marinus]TVM36459.1 ABC transporter permease [Oceanidesulfovibrio marinus]